MGRIKRRAYKLSNVKHHLFREEYCVQLVEHMAEGYSFSSFGAVIGVTLPALTGWVKEHEEFAEAKEIGKLCQLKEWEEILMMNAKGLASGGAGALKFAMTNYFPDEFKEKSTVQHDGNVVFQIESGIDYNRAENMEFIEGEFREIKKGEGNELPSPSKEEAL